MGGPGLRSQTVVTEMACVRIREAIEEDCGTILRLIRVKAAGHKLGSQRVSGRAAGGGGGEGRGRSAPWGASGPYLP